MVDLNKGEILGFFLCMGMTHEPISELKTYFKQEQQQPIYKAILQILVVYKTL